MMSRYISSVKPKKNGKTTKVKMAFGQIRPNDIENNGKKLGAPDTRKRVLFTGYPGGDAYNISKQVITFNIQDFEVLSA